MEAPLHQSPVPFPPPPAPAQDAAVVGAAALLQQAVAARALMAAGEKPPPPPAAMGREQCPRCASRDTKFCYYNNYNTAQPRHFCRACRRYWTLGGSLRNVPVGGSTRKRPRPARPTRAIAAAVAAAANTTLPTTTSAGALFASPAPAGVAAPSPPPAMQGSGLLGSLLLGPASSPGLLGFGLGIGQPAPLGDSAGQQLGFGAGPLLWPGTTILEGNRAEEEAAATWKATGGVLQLPFPPVAALWQELSSAAPVDAGGLLPHLLL